MYASLQRYTRFFRSLMFTCDNLEAKLEPCGQASDAFESLRAVVEEMKSALLDLSEKPEDSLPTLVLTDEMAQLQREKEVLAGELRRTCCERLVAETRVGVAAHAGKSGVSVSTVSPGVVPATTVPATTVPATTVSPATTLPATTVSSERVSATSAPSKGVSPNNTSPSDSFDVTPSPSFHPSKCWSRQRRTAWCCTGSTATRSTTAS